MHGMHFANCPDLAYHEFARDYCSQGVPHHENELGMRRDVHHAGSHVRQACVHWARIKAHPLRIQDDDG